MFASTNQFVFEYMHELSKLSKKELKNEINKMKEEDAKEFLYNVLCSMFRHDRTGIEDISKF